MSISVIEVSKLYGTQLAVDNISFEVKKGEIVGFLGPNGAGKSTTMKIITGFITASKGVAMVGGIDVQKNPLGAKHKIGYLPEANPLYTDMYLQEYLYFIAGIHGIKQRTKAVNNAIALTGLTVEKNKKIHQLSKGYKQRVGLAAALIHNPEVLILDEPTSGLDPNQIIEIRNVIKAQGQNKTVLFSSHILQEVEAICDRIIIINKGKIVANDSLNHLRTQTQSGVVQVVFAEHISENLLQHLGQINIQDLSKGTAYTITGSSSELIKKQLLEIALSNNLNIVSLQSSNYSLEEVFKSLTSK